MPLLSFSLSPEAAAKIHDLLTCLAKFGDSVSLEARNDRFSLTTLNSSRTAYASFAIEPETFFLSYDFSVQGVAADGRFTCQLANRALISAFKNRLFDARGRDTAIERCDVSVHEEPDKTECRLVIKMICRYGVIKTYRLTYESVEIMHALFDKSRATNGWTISSRVLREYIEYFGTKTEQLDMQTKDGKAIFTSFTEKIMDGKEILKQPLETAIAIHVDDFDQFQAEEDMHIVINVRDFKAIVIHADTLRTPITAHFSRPSRPLQFVYLEEGLRCEYTLMTTGDYRGTSSTPAPSAKVVARPSTTSTQQSVVRGPSTESAAEMPPPARPATNVAQLQRKPLTSLGKGTLGSQSQRSESLFVARDEDDDDRRWDAPNYEEEAAAEDMLGWDASGEMNVGFPAMIHDGGSNLGSAQSVREVGPPAMGSQGLEPTQRLSQLHGLFD